MKIYISSTFQDLQEYREKAYRQLRSLRHDVISMEDMVAAHQRPLAQCLADVAASDVYVGIFAWRYGFVPAQGNPQKLSITELEYRHALKLKKPCLIFLLNKDTQWLPQFMDSQTGEGKGGKSVRRLRDELSQRHVVSFFSNPDQLASAISAALFPVQFAETPVPAAPPPPTARAARATRAGATATTAHEGPRASARDGYPKLWKPGDRLRVRFLDGTPKQRHFVERFVPIWSAYANIRFEFGDDPAAEIRVSFAQPGSWAYVGTDALNIPAGEPTANFGWVTDRTRDTEIDYTIIHEFGHVLGLRHEHENPQAKIPWNKEAVYKAFEGPPNYWSRETVNHMLFSRWDPKHFPYEKPFDRESIMAFPLPPDYTGKDFEMGQNMSLSPGDKEFIHRLYPYDEDGGADDNNVSAKPSKRKPSKRRAGSR
jgi:hypothetical protein